MTRIFLVRHGQTAWSRTGQHTSITDLDLTEEGERQARALRGRLDPDAFDLVLSSPRLRARRTAELAGFPAARVEITDDLAEWFYGDYEGRTGDDIRAEQPGWTIWTGTTPGGETVEQVRARLTRLIDRILSCGAEQVLCFGHGHALRALTLCWLGLDFARGDSFPLETGTVSVLAPDRGVRALSRWNAEP